MTFNDSCLQKQAQIKQLFASCTSPTEKYSKIIELGRTQPPLEERFKTDENIVQGCQGTMYLHTSVEGDRVYFQTSADALISAGLAMILVDVYSGETAETILKCPPAYLEELGLGAALSPGRANGLYSIHLRMKQEALKVMLNRH